MSALTRTEEVYALAATDNERFPVLDGQGRMIGWLTHSRVPPRLPRTIQTPPPVLDTAPAGGAAQEHVG